MPAPPNPIGLIRLLPAALLALCSIALAGCVERLSVDGVPGVPVGFGERVPDVPLSGYLFVRPIGEETALEIDARLTRGNGSTFQWRANPSSVALWLSPVDVTAGEVTTTLRFSFETESEAIAADVLLSRVSADVETWAHRAGRDVEFVMGEQAQVEAMRDILDGNLFAPTDRLSQTGMWRSALSLPQAPPKPVIAAGFTRIAPEHIAEILLWLRDQGIIDLTEYGDMLETLQVDNAVFAVYGNSVPTLSETTSIDDLTGHGLTGLAIARTGVPGPLVSWGFNVAALRANLERVDSRTGRHYRYRDDDMVVLAQVRSGDIQVAASETELDAARILALIPN